MNVFDRNVASSSNAVRHDMVLMDEQAKHFDIGTGERGQQ